MAYKYLTDAAFVALGMVMYKVYRDYMVKPKEVEALPVNDTTPMPASPSKATLEKATCFMGIGGGGSNVVEDIAHIDEKHHFLILNSDRQALHANTIATKVDLAPDSDGLGCGGSKVCGKGLVEEAVKQTLHDLTETHSHICIVATLGGGVGSGATPEVVKYLQSLGKKLTVTVTIPFEFEGKVRQETAMQALKELQALTPNVLVHHNDEMLQNKDIALGLRASFEEMSRKMYMGLVRMEV